MNEEFEVMPFAAQETELESGKARGRSGNRAARKVPPRGPSRPPGAGWYGRPRTPRYGWPYGAALPYLQPYAWREPEPFLPEPQPQPQPEPEPGMDGQDSEIPARLQAVIDSLPAGKRPQYKPLGTVAQALARPETSGPGLYLLVFNDGKRAYSGHSGNVRRRLLQHQLCAKMLGFDISRYEVYMHAMPNSARQQRRPIEFAFHDKALPLRILTNQHREQEAEVMGESWV
jgi:hypothetical protein